MVFSDSVPSDWSKERIAAFRKRFLDWYDQEKRTLPWRTDSNPYRIWISEIMLQQTRVDTVIPYYERFMQQFPTIAALAAAPEEQLLKAWEGLGYYSRARNLQIAAQTIMQEHAGQMPADPSAILALKGIGPYTAGAIASIAFQLPEPAVDGNVMRVFSRLFTLKVDIAIPASRKVFEQYVRWLIDPERPGDFNQACMDLGATICTPTQPACAHCPLQADCLAFQANTQENYPIKTKKKAAQPVFYLALAIRDPQGRYLLVQRPKTGLLANMWTFPMIALDQADYQTLQADWKNYLAQKKQVTGQLDLFGALTSASEISAGEQLAAADSELLLHFLTSLLPEQQSAAAQIVWQKQPVGEVTHLFSHLKWHLLLCFGQSLTDLSPELVAQLQLRELKLSNNQIEERTIIMEEATTYSAAVAAAPAVEHNWQLLAPEQLDQVTLPKSQQKLLDLLFKEQNS